jgi:cytochrome c oxidase assembly protein subunit 15
MTLLRRLSSASLAATLVLVAIGGLVRATKSGLGCGTDWPDCLGRLTPALHDRAMVIEFSHRAAAGIVVAMLASLAVVAIARHRGERRILWTAIAALGLVIFQALLGAAVVILELKADLVVVHLAAALSLVALLVYLRASLIDPSTKSEELDRPTARRAGFAAVSVLVLLLVGSYLSGVGEAQRAGFPDWPLIGGRLIPDLSIEITALHWFHRVLAAVVGVIVFVVGWGVIRQKETRPAAARFARAAVGLYAIELLIGAANVWTQSNQALNSASITLHLALGALTWASLIAVAAVTHPGVRAPAGARSAARPALEGSG